VNCETATHLISAKIDGEIAPADRAALEAHLEECAGCRATADVLTGLDSEIDQAFGERRSMATAVAERVISQIRVEPVSHVRESATRSFWANWGRPLIAAAAGFGLAIVLMRPWDKANVPVANATTGTSPVRVAVNPTTKPIAQLALATGEVFVCPSNSDEWRALDTGGSVQAGTKVRTGKKAMCEFNLNDGSQVRMNADTQMTMASARRVEVTGGQVFSSVRPQEAGDPFVLKTSPSQATLTGVGTAFDVSCSPAKTVCTVVEGSIKMEAGGKENTVRSRESLTLADGNFSDKKVVENLMQATQWVDEILVLKGRDNAELAWRIDDIFAQLGHEKMWYMHAQEVRRLGDHCVIPLVRYIQSDRSQATQDDQSKRREAARIVGDVATTWAIPELINLLADSDGEVRYPAAVALRRLTGQSLGRRPEEWRDQSLMTCTPSIDQWHTWWEQNKSRFPGTDRDGVRPFEMKGKG
jgi:hypothetical protein